MRWNDRLLRSTVLLPIFALGCSYFVSTVPEIEVSEFEASYRKDLSTLASNKFQGRLPGSLGGERTVKYLVERFRSMGLEPGNNGSYLQEVKLQRNNTFASSNVITNSVNISLNLEQDTHILTTLLGEGDMLKLNGTEMVFVGLGSDAPDFGWDDYAGVDVEGKMVVMLRNHAGWVAKDSTILNDPKNRTHGFFSTKFRVAKEHGALGAIVIIDTALWSSLTTWKERIISANHGETSLYNEESPDSVTRIEAIIDLGIGKELLALVGYDYDSLLVAA